VVTAGGSTLPENTWKARNATTAAAAAALTPSSRPDAGAAAATCKTVNMMLWQQSS